MEKVAKYKFAKKTFLFQANLVARLLPLVEERPLVGAGDVSAKI
jgi:hypothetical protein